MKTKRESSTARVALVLLALVASIALDCGYSHAGVGSIKAAAVVREEYDDNIFLTKENREFDWITRAVPTVDLSYKTPWWDLALADTFNAWYYARLNKVYYSNTLNLSSKIVAVKNFAYFDVIDTYASVILEPRRNATDVNFNVNRSDSNVLNASPYIKYDLDLASYVKAGYTYTNIWYRSSAGTNRQQHKGFAALDHKFSPVFEASVGGEYVADRPEGDVESTTPEARISDNQEAAYATVIYNFSPGTRFDGTAGFRWARFEDNRNHDRTIYNAGVAFGLTGPAMVELRGSSDIYPTALNGVAETTKQAVTFRYGQVETSAVSLRAGVFHRVDDYVQIVRTDETVGATARIDISPGPRTTLHVSGSYEHGEYQPDAGRRNLYTAGAGMDYKVTPKVTFSLMYEYNRSTSDNTNDDYFDNHAAVQLRAEL